jgi:hypothetical protein
MADNTELAILAKRRLWSAVRTVLTCSKVGAFNFRNTSKRHFTSAVGKTYLFEPSK